MTAIGIFTLLCLLLVLGKLLRSLIPILQWLYLPSSVIGGILGLGLLSIFPQLIPSEWIAGIRQLPSFLINIVFAGLFLGASTPSLKKVCKLAFPQFCYGQVQAWGQYVIGLGLAICILGPLFGIAPAFGNLLEVGFEGGHGTVGGMADSMRQLGWSDGIALGYTIATFGMIFGVIIGIILINWAGRRGILKYTRSMSEASIMERRGIYAEDEAPDAGKQTVIADSIDSLAWHIALIGLAILIGWGILEACKAIELALVGQDAGMLLMGAFPLFPLCMIGGLILQKLVESLGLAKLIHHGQMQRLSGAALDFLVVSAVATIQLSVVTANWQALLILIIVGIAWSVFLLLKLAPRLFKEDWFERGIAEFGQSMGVTATGLLLLRTVDPDNKSTAPEAFGYKQLLHEPIMGGGLWTAIALPLVFTIGALPVLAISAVMLVIWGGIAYYLSKRES